MHERQLTAVTSLKYRGRRITPGESFIASRKDAKALVYLKRARQTDAPTASEQPVPDAATDLPVSDVQSSTDADTYQTTELTPEQPETTKQSGRASGYRRKVVTPRG